MDVALAALREDGWRSVTLWVLAENHPARDFYARFGIGPDGAEMTHERSGEKEVRLRVASRRKAGAVASDSKRQPDGYGDSHSPSTRSPGTAHHP